MGHLQNCHTSHLLTTSLGFTRMLSSTMLSKQCYNARFIVSSKTMLSGRQMDHQGQGDDARSHVPRVFPRDMLVVVAERERERERVN